MTRSSAANPSIRSAACPFCERLNPSDSMFCNACGTPLQLVPCPSCGAVNDPTATTCHQCAAPLPEDRLAGLGGSLSAAEASDAAGTGAWTAEDGTEPIAQPSPGPAHGDRDTRLFATLEELQQLLVDSDPGAATSQRDERSLGTQMAKADVRTTVTPVADALVRAFPASAIVGSPAVRTAPRVVPRRGPAVIVGTVVLAALAATGYYAYREGPVLDAAQGPVASGAVKDGGGPAGGGVNPSASAGGTMPIASTQALAVTPPVTAEAEPVLLTPAPPAATARPRATGAGPSLELQRPRVGPCTEAVAALGLCTPEPAQRRE
jgi:hypothetical protein